MPFATSTSHRPNRSVLVVGASRGLGEALVENYVSRGAHVVATVRNDALTTLHDFAATVTNELEIEHLDITSQDQITALAARLAGRQFDVLFIVVGISLVASEVPAAATSTEDFTAMMVTNVLGTVRTVEGLQDLVEKTGTIAVMSSGQGSITNNTSGGFEVYRATKSALNQLMRSYAARHEGEQRTLLLMAPGWVKTGLGGPGAPLEIGESIPPLVDTVDAQHGTPGLQYLDRHGKTLPW